MGAISTVGWLLNWVVDSMIVVGSPPPDLPLGAQTYERDEDDSLTYIHTSVRKLGSSSDRRYRCSALIDPRRVLAKSLSGPGPR